MSESGSDNDLKVTTKDNVESFSDNDVNDASESEELEKDVRSNKENGHTVESVEGKRSRKVVQRLSETWNRAHVEQMEKKAKAAKDLSATFEAGPGTELGVIPSIEANIRKWKPINLKPLHLVLFGRMGAMHEIRSNLRKFHGFSFKSGSPEYVKKLDHTQQRQTNELRDMLRIMNLEVNGTRAQMAQRLLDFLLSPSATLVKNKGEVKSRSKGHAPKKHKKKSDRAGSRTMSSSTTSGNAPVSELSDSEPDADEVSDLDDNSSISEPEVVPPKQKNPPQTTHPKKRSAAPTAADESVESKKPKSKRKATPKKLVSTASDDEDVPLSSLVPPKPVTKPSKEELKKEILALLKTVNLEETTLKVVREKIFAHYTGVDLSEEKDFINNTVRDYVANF